MLIVITTQSDAHFVVESESIHKHNGIIQASFIMLFANKTMHPTTNAKKSTKKVPSYEYPSKYFNNLNLVKVSNIISKKMANKIESDLYQRIKSNRPLSKEIREYLREHYLIENVVL